MSDYKAVRDEIGSYKPVPKLSFAKIYMLFCLCKGKPSRTRHKRLIEKATSRVDRYTDLRKFVFKQRAMAQAILSQLGHR